jgi:hypothetical protein
MIDDSERARRAREFFFEVLKRYGGKGILTVGLIQPRKYDFSHIVADFASNGGALFVLDGQPKFLIEFHVERERLASDRYSYDVSANFIDLRGRGGAEILYTSRKKRSCMVKRQNIGYRCQDFPDRLIEASLYSFIHP